MPEDTGDREPLRGDKRDRVAALGNPPTIVSLSDIHGYLSRARSALLGVGDHDGMDPIVEADEEGLLHWAGNDYVLVVNGDLIDRGPDSAETLAMAERLRREAPHGHVRLIVGNHEMALLVPDALTWPEQYSVRQSVEDRVAFMDLLLDGHAVAAYEGHDVVYAHAGRPGPYDVTELNDRLEEAVSRLREAAGTEEDVAVQEAVIDEYPELFGIDGQTGRGPGAGIFWMDFEHMPEDAPAQVVGHTRQTRPVRKGNVVNQNVIRENLSTPGGEAALVESADRLVAVVRTEDGDVGVIEP